VDFTGSEKERLFNAAAELSDPAQRSAFLNAACFGDEALRAGIEDLLRHDLAAGDFLESPAVDPCKTSDLGSTAGSECGKTVIGPYKLLQPIGEGGMGTVYMAEQTQPVRRVVALKLIKAGMDSRQVLARFGAERQALALMDHPNIAKVFDAGTTDNGRPYFVMELVKGIPITRFCDEHRLTTRERLELAIPVCQAVQHAHQKGIIHRDLKPSNVLIALYDSKPVPKVIDFGVAKATGPRLTDQTLYTEFGAVVGTLEYMSPEQAQLNQLDIDTRSDIYSLGVLVYELLTGSTPLDRKRLRQGALLEMLRVIREEESPRPSMRLSTTEELPSIAACRNIEARKLSGLMRGELDWIVMKALEKDRSRRYETANGFAADLQRYLSDEPVKACPPSAPYRLRKFARRNRVALTTAALLTAALLTTVVVLAVSNVWVTWERDEKQLALAETKASEETAKAQEKLARENLGKAREAEDRAMHRLYDARLAQARAGSLSRRIGQRFESLDAVGQARKIARDLNQGEERLLELRNAAIACLALPDLKIAKEWGGWPTGTWRVNFDSTLERYARADRQGVISIRTVADDAEILRLAGGPGQVSAWFSPDGQFVALSGENYRFKVWKLTAPEPVVVVPEMSAPGGARFSPDSRRLAIGYADGSIRLHELPSGRQLKRIEGVPSPYDQAFHPDGRQLAVSCATGVQIFDLESGTILANLAEHGAAFCLAWHPDGKTLAVAGADRIIHIWDVANSTTVARLEGHNNNGITFCYDHAGDLLASTCWDGRTRLWDPRTGQQLFNSRAWGFSLRFSPDDRFLAAEVADTKLRIWEVARPSVYQTLVENSVLGRALHYTGCAISPDGRVLALTHEAGVSFWDLPQRRLLAIARTGNMRTLVFPSCNALLTGGPTGVLRWPVQEDVGKTGLRRIGPPTRLLPFRGDVIGSSSDGRVITSPQGAGALVLDQDYPDRPIPLTPHADVRFTAVSPDGQWAATGSHFHTKVKIWAARTGKLVKELPVESGSMVGFSPDGEWLATTGGGLSLWAVGSWEPGKQFGGVTFAFAPDSQLLAVETGHGVIRLVSPESGQEYARLADPNQETGWSICFSPDGAQIALTSDSQSIHVWDLRAIRDQLVKMGLDWNLPPYPPAPKVDETQPLRAEVELGDPPQSPRDQEVTTREAIEQKRRALDANPTSAEACNDLAWTILMAPDALRDWKAALPLAQKAVELKNDPMFRNTLGLAYYRAGRYREAVEALQPNLKDQADSALAYDFYFLAMSHHQLGEPARARQFYDLAVRWSAAHSEALKPYLEESTAIQAEAAEVLRVKDNKH
jgi:eukaryotic-like serine/threonine-protein kinase